MKRILVGVVPVFLSGCGAVGMSFHNLGGSFGQKQLVGNGVTKEESRKVASFERVVVGSAFRVSATEGVQSPLKLTADSNLLSKIKTEVKNKTLYVTIDGSVSSKKNFELYVSAPTLNGFEASGASEVALQLKSRHNFDLHGSGASHVKVDGPVSDLDCELSGASNAQFSTKSFGRVNLNLSGASEFKASATVNALDAELSGASSLTGGMNGNTADLRLSGASNSSIGKFAKLKKETSGASCVTIR